MSGISDKAIKSQYAVNKYRANGGSELQNQEFSDGSGLEAYDAVFRMYDPQIGRFWQIDPLADWGESWSPYSFVLDNPISFNDPIGLKDSLDPVIVTPGNNAPPCCQIAFIPGTGSPGPVDIPPPPDEVPDIPLNVPTGNPGVNPIEDPIPTPPPVVLPAVGITAVLVGIPITGNTNWPHGQEMFYHNYPELTRENRKPVTGNTPLEDIYLNRFGPGPESKEKLAADAAKAAGNPEYGHGVSTRIANKPLLNARAAKLLDVMKVFEIKKTGPDPRHWTVVLPNPVTQEVADKFNTLFTPQ